MRLRVSSSANIALFHVFKSGSCTVAGSVPRLPRTAMLDKTVDLDTAVGLIASSKYDVPEVVVSDAVFFKQTRPRPRVTGILRGSELYSRNV